jgi:hypothetical protein
MLNIVLSHNWLSTASQVIKLQACLVQALPDSASPLSQLPGISPEQADELQFLHACDGSKWAARFMKADVKDFDEAKNAIKDWPILEILDAEFRGKSKRQSMAECERDANIGSCWRETCHNERYCVY